MPIVLYNVVGSPPCSTVILAAAQLGIPLKIKEMDFANGEHKKEAFLKINPHHTVPTIDDDGFILWESNAIITYLVNKYTPGHKLYPSDPKQRATVEKFLCMNENTLYHSILQYFDPQWYEKKPASPVLLEKLHHALEQYETFLAGKKFLTGDSLCLADISASSALMVLYEVTGLPGLEKFSRIKEYYNTVKQELEPHFTKTNEKAIEIFKMWVRQLTQ